MSKQDDELGSRITQEGLEPETVDMMKELDEWPGHVRALARLIRGDWSDKKAIVTPCPNKGEPVHMVVRRGRTVTVVAFNPDDTEKWVSSEELATEDDAVEHFQKVYASQCAAAEAREKTRSQRR